MTTDKFCFHLQNRQIQTSQTGGQWYSDTSPLVFPGKGHMFVFPWLQAQATSSQNLCAN